MDNDLQRRELMSEYQNYVSIISQKGLHFDVLSEDELKQVSVADLSILVRKARDLARTPT